MKRLIALFIGFVIGCVYSNAQSLNALNNLFSTYNQNIKVCNPHWHPNPNSCIYEAGNIKAELQGKTLVISYLFSNTISKDVMKIDLSKATFQTGYWGYYQSQKTWYHSGKKEVISIKDSDGIDYFSTGLNSYNQGTRQDLLPEFYISCGTEPIANRIINEIYKIQEHFKTKEPWLLPEPIPQNEATTSPTKNASKKQNNNKPSESNTPKKVGRYVQ